MLRGWRTKRKEERGNLIRWVRVVTDCHSSPTNRCLACSCVLTNFTIVLAASWQVVPHCFSITLRAQDLHLRGILYLLEPSVSPSKQRLAPPRRKIVLGSNNCPNPPFFGCTKPYVMLSVYGMRRDCFFHLQSHWTTLFNPGFNLIGFSQPTPIGVGCR